MCPNIEDNVDDEYDSQEDDGYASSLESRKLTLEENGIFLLVVTLLDAAEDGDVQRLRDIPTNCQSESDYSLFCALFKKLDIRRNKDNIFHIAAGNRRLEFFKEAMTGPYLPKATVLSLLSQRDEKDCNPLHVAANEGETEIVKLIYDYCRLPAGSGSLEGPNSYPRWLEHKANSCWMPFHLALHRGFPHGEECALIILENTMDSKTLLESTDGYGECCLSIALRTSCNKVALKILNSAEHYSVRNGNGTNPFHYVLLKPAYSGEVFRKLLEKHKDLIKEYGEDKWSVLHQWASVGTWPSEMGEVEIPAELEKDIIELLKLKVSAEKGGHFGQTPLHVAVNKDNSGFVTGLVEFYKKASPSSSEQSQLPWLIPMPNNDSNSTPLHMSILNKLTDITSKFLSMKISDSEKALGLLKFAIENDNDTAAEAILKTQFGYGSGLESTDGQNVLIGVSKFSEKVATWLIKKMPKLISKKDENGNTPLDEVSEAGYANNIKLMFQADPHALANVPLAWVKACEQGHLEAVFAFLDQGSKFTELCRQIKDTPLHHIKLDVQEGYGRLLKHKLSAELINLRNTSIETPLHTAISARDLRLTKALLGMPGINTKIRDKRGKTAKKLLRRLCKQNKEWKEECITVAPWLDSTFLRSTEKLLEVRSTLSVVAALLATITFTAGFTLPGGVNGDIGEAVLANDAVFLVFLLSNTFAMCCSMLVLVCLTWSMVCKNDQEAVPMIDRSVYMLMVSLWSTLIAFMTGVYAVIHQKTLWAAVIILVMCSLIAIVFLRRILLFVFKMFGWLSNWLSDLSDRLSYCFEKEDTDETRTMEEGLVGNCCGGGGRKCIGKHSCTCCGCGGNRCT